MVSVELKDVTKRFGKVVAVDTLNLAIRDKEFFVLLGPSGSGKTTALNIIAGLEKPDQGRLLFGDEDVTDLPAEKRNVAMVFQSYALYPHMKVFDNIAFHLKIKKVPKEEIKRKVNEATELLRIRELLNRMPYQLSGGQRQRVALARAIVRAPSVYLLDEPLSNIDAKLRVYARAELTRLQKELEITAIYVTHDQVEAMTMADRIALLEDGKVVQVGTPSNLFRTPVNTFVAGFLGTPPMNLFNGNFRETKDGGLLEMGGYTLSLPNEVTRALKESGTSELVLGLRPENVSVHKEKQGKEDIDMEVFTVEDLGSETVVNLRNRVFGEAIFKARLPYEFHAKLGESVWATLDKNFLHYFNMQGQRVALLT